MPEEVTMSTMPRCLNCGYEAALDEGGWNSVEAPPLGNLTQCPECNSTNILGRW
jgi:predicted Zn-ribbon and HTH transcriptional regulator